MNKKEKCTHLDYEHISIAAHEIAQGNLEGDKIVVVSKPLQTMANDIMEISKNLNTYVMEISRVLSHLSVGDLSVRLSNHTEYPGDFIPIKTAMENMIMVLVDTFSNITSVMDEINHISNQTRNSADIVAGNENTISNNMNKVSLKAKEIQDKTDISTLNVIHVSEQMEQMAQSVQCGNEYISELVQSISEVNTASHNISGISKMIQSISSQTKLLALNASIEASRAGENGRGFAVVASEIRKLAEQSNQAAQDTTELIDTSVKKVKQCQEAVKKTEEQFQEIDNSIQLISIESKSIAESTAQQQTDISQIFNSIDNSYHAIQNNVILTQENAGLNERLQNQTNRLQDILSHFILEKNMKLITNKDVIENEALNFIANIENKLMSTSNIETNYLDNVLLSTLIKERNIECAYIISHEGIQLSNTIMSQFIDTENLKNFNPALPGTNHKGKNILARHFVKRDRYINPTNIYREQLNHYV